MARDRLVFYLGDAPVGRFRGRRYPTHPGRVEYVPYRGTGHARLAAALRRGEAPTCWFARGGGRVAFEVVREEFVLGPPGSRSNWYVEVLRLGESPDAEPLSCPPEPKENTPPDGSLGNV